MRQAFRRDLKTIGADPSKFGLHSLSSGNATMAANSGVSDRVFQRHGHWNSAQSKDMYVDDNLDRATSFPGPFPAPPPSQGKGPGNEVVDRGLSVSKFLGL